MYFGDYSTELQFTETSQVVDEEDDTIGAIVLEGDEGPLFVSCGRDHFEKSRNKFVKRWDRRDAAVTTFIVNAKADFDFVRTQMCVGNGSAGDLDER